MSPDVLRALIDSARLRPRMHAPTPDALAWCLFGGLVVASGDGRRVGDAWRDPGDARWPASDSDDVVCDRALRAVDTLWPRIDCPSQPVAPLPDDPEADGTDAAHPAWWRGQDAGCKGALALIARLRAEVDALRRGEVFRALRDGGPMPNAVCDRLPSPPTQTCDACVARFCEAHAKGATCDGGEGPEDALDLDALLALPAADLAPHLDADDARRIVAQTAGVLVEHFGGPDPSPSPYVVATTLPEYALNLALGARRLTTERDEARRRLDAVAGALHGPPTDGLPHDTRGLAAEVAALRMERDVRERRAAEARAPDLDAIEALLRAAPQGPYYDDGDRVHAPAFSADPRDGDVLAEYKHFDTAGREAAGALFAASPTIVRDLLARVQELERQIARMREHTKTPSPHDR